MDKLDNLEKIIEYFEKAYYNVKDAEESLEENVMPKKLHRRILKVQDELEDILDSLEVEMENVE